MEPECHVRSLDFVIDKNQSTFVKNAEERIAYLFNVTVKLNGVFENSPKHQQWICVTGTENEIMKAKEYILALTSPTETIHMKNITGHPLFTEEKQDEIEKSTCAALAKYGDDDLVISGTELSVILAQSMIDDLFSRSIADFSDNERNGIDFRNFVRDSESVRYTYHDPYVKDNDREELRGSASLNKNNSSLTSVIPQSSSASTGTPAAHYSNSILASDPRSSPHKITTSTLHTPFSSSGSGVFPACSPTMQKAMLGRDSNWRFGGDGSPSNSSNIEGTVTEKPLFPHQLTSNSSYASASTIFPRAPGKQMFVSAVSKYNTHAALTNVALHTVNHTGDGAASKMSSGQVGFSEIPMEVGNLDSGIDLPYFSPQAKYQQDYLRNLGQSLHYTNEDIEKGLACYHIEDVIKPSEFLENLKRIKAQRHGEGHQNVGTDYRENPSMPRTSTSMGVFSTRMKSQTASSEPSMDNLDDSLICVGSFGDVNAIVVSSDDEVDEPEKTVTVPQNSLPPQNFLTRPLSEIQPPVRKEPTLSKDRAAAMNSNSFTMEEGSTTSRKPTVNRNLRYIIIDGSNVAMAHGDNKVFSVEGLRICINYFVKRGHDRITAFVPESRRYSENTPRSGRVLLEKLGNAGYIKFTPARRINGKTIASYDDRFILNLAEKEEGIVVSNDQFRDLCKERASYQDIVANRLLQFMFVADHFMPPDDPLGRHGPHLDDFLRYPHQPHKQSYTSGKGIQPSLMEERLMVNQKKTNHRPSRKKFEQGSRQPIRSPDVTAELFQKLSQMFPEPNQESKIHTVLNNHKQETDLTRLANFCMNALFT